MKRTSGMLVETKSGKGRTYSWEKSVNGKLVVHLIDKNFQPILDDKGNPMKILCQADAVKVKGFID